MRRFRALPRIGLLVVGNLLVLALALALIEGLASLILFAGSLGPGRAATDRRHTEYDPELGWIHEPDLRLPDMYGPGVFLSTNGQRFRGRRDFAPRPPAGKTRLICTGDSFTLGFGVDDEQTWCQQLTRIDPRLETVNMGQAGYGVDQAYLWYRRDAAALEHQTVLFAFVTPDLYRADTDSFYGYAKPVLEVREGRLEVGNVPVPRRAYWAPWITGHLEEIHGLRLVQLVDRWRGAVAAAAAPNRQARDARVERLLATLLTELERLTASRSSRLVLVHLPTLPDHRGSAWRRWSAFVGERCAALGVPFVDLVTELRRLPAGAAHRLFLNEDDSPVPGVAGHYNAEGHRQVARWLHRELRAAGVLEPAATAGPYLRVRPSTAPRFPESNARSAPVHRMLESASREAHSHPRTSHPDRCPLERR